MIPPFGSGGRLPQGIHWARRSELVNRFGWNEHRRRLLAGLTRAIDSLQTAGCRTVYIDGSFVTRKELPGDFDACWDATGVTIGLLDPALRTFDRGRVTQKAIFLGELFPAHFTANGAGTTYLEFFQIDRQTGRRKGIVAIALGVEP